MRGMRFHQAWKMYDLIPMKHKSILPDEGFATRDVDITGNGMIMPVYCKPKGKGSKHRVFVICDCGRDIPFGRMGQHFPKCKGRY
jgi:hypothetical protein